MFIREYIHIKKTLLMVVFASLLVFPYARAADTCNDCHKDDKFRVQNRVLYDYYQNWENSVHELAGIACADCHGGDPSQSDKDSAHGKDFTSLSSMRNDSFKKIPQKCGKCHEMILTNFTESKHYKALIEKGSGPHCSTCHGSMNSEVYYTPIVSGVCRECHNEYTKNMPEIAGEADKILHRINVSRVFRNWISIYYADSDPQKVKAMNAKYKDIAYSWHSFNFTELDEKSESLLNELKALVNKKLIESKKTKGK